jgi:ABC-2 type transport system permease protein
MSVWNGKYALLVRRELWEHRTLWLAPLSVALLVVIVPMFADVNFGSAGDLTVTAPNVPPEAYSMFGRTLLTGIASVLGIIASMVSLAYLLDCLFAERKDRSILFWKSLPVSDAQTVLTKLGVALLLVPLLTLLVALVTHVLLTGALQLRYPSMRPVLGFESVVDGFRAMPQLAGLWLITLLWYAPVATYLMLASVLAKRAPLMYAVLPPAVLILCEGLWLDSKHVLMFLGERLVPWARFDWSAEGSRGTFMGPGGNWSAQLQSLELWLGLAAAAGMVYIVIRLRRYRDDT